MVKLAGQNYRVGAAKHHFLLPKRRPTLLKRCLGRIKRGQPQRGSPRNELRPVPLIALTHFGSPPLTQAVLFGLLTSLFVMPITSASDRIRLVQGDITRQEVSAIVNAANSGLLGGGGVDGAIHRAGGPAILAECRLIRASPDYRNGLPTGEAVLTTGGQLPAPHVIHTAGPVWHGGHRGESELLANCYRNCLRLAAEHGLDSLAFPGISTGIYGYPKREATAIAVQVVREFLSQSPLPKTVVFVVSDDDSRRCYEEELRG